MIDALRESLSARITTLGKRLKFDAHYFAKNSFHVAFGHGINIAKGLITGYLVTRMFPKEMYGEYRLVMQIAGLVGVISLSGLPAAISRAVANDQDKAPLRFTMHCYAVFSLLGTVVLLIMIPLLSFWNREALWPMFLIEALLFVPTSVGTTFFGGIIAGTGAFREALRANYLASILVALSVALMLFLYPSPILLLTFVNAFPTIIYLKALRKMIRKYPSEERNWSIFRSGLHLTFAALPMSLSSYVDSIIIAGLFGAKELATFSVALLIPEQVKQLFKELSPIAFSKQAKGRDTQERRKHIVRIVMWGTGIFVIGITLYVVCIPWFIPWLFPQYDAHQVFVLTSAAAITLITIPSNLFVQNLEARGKIHHLQIAQWVASFAFIVALLILAPTYGPLGAIISRGIFRVLLGGISWLFVAWGPIEEA